MAKYWQVYFQKKSLIELYCTIKSSDKIYLLWQKYDSYNHQI